MAKTEVIWSPSALACLDEITDYIAQDAPLRAADFAERLLSSTDHLEDFPLSGTVCPESASYRHIVVEGYRVIYEPFDGHIDVVAIISPGQNSLRILSKQTKEAE